MNVLLVTTCTPDDRKPVCFSRELARAGATVGIAGDRHVGEAFYSRYLSRRHLCARPAVSLDDFISDLNRHIERYRYDIVLPMNDYTTVGLCIQRGELAEGVATVLPDYEALEITRDKQRTLTTARELGLDVPKSFAPSDEGELLNAGDSVGYPCVLKLRRGAGAVGCRVVRNQEELVIAWRRRRRQSDLVFDHDHLLVQEFVAGLTHDACVLFCRGEPRAILTQKRLWTHPREGGVGTIVESTRDPQLADLACRFFRALRWHGPAQAEFKVDPESGRVCLIEVNGRFWGTIGAAVDAGVNFPLLASRMALEGDIDQVCDYSVGRRYRYPIPFGVLAIMDRTAKWQAAKAFFGPARRTACDLDLRDPMPLLAELIFIAKRLTDSK
jgi:predicted ATP-grasp superfamily ATP-dependent carboligase